LVGFPAEKTIMLVKAGLCWLELVMLFSSNLSWFDGPPALPLIFNEKNTYTLTGLSCLRWSRLANLV